MDYDKVEDLVISIGETIQDNNANYEEVIAALLFSIGVILEELESTAYSLEYEDGSTIDVIVKNDVSH